MALSHTRTERKFETEITAQIEAFTDNGNSLVFIIILIFYGQFCISFVPCSMFSLFWIGVFFASEVFLISSYNIVTAFNQSSFKSHTAKGCHKKSK